MGQGRGRRARRLVLQAGLWAVLLTAHAACDAGGSGWPDGMEGALDAGPDGVSPDHVGGPEPGTALVEAGGDPASAAVVALLANGRLLCSGALVAPRTVVTAAHCLVGSRLSASDLRVFFGPRLAGPGEEIPAVTWVAHPGYQVLPDGVPLHDVACLTLAHEAPVEPLPWRSTKLPSLVGSAIRAISYGPDGASPEAGQEARRTTSLDIVDQDAAFLYPAGGATWTSRGEAGGATLWREGDHLTLVAIASYGPAEGGGPGGSTRVDTHAAFLASQAPPTGTPALPTVDEAEPNSGYDALVTDLPAPCHVVAELCPVGDVDTYRVTLPGGATLEAELDAQGAPAPRLRLTDAGGDRLDAEGTGEETQGAVTWTNLGAGAAVVYVRVFGPPGPGARAATGYTLRISW